MINDDLRKLVIIYETDSCKEPNKLHSLFYIATAVESDIVKE